MAAPHGDMAPDEASAEVLQAMQLLADLQEMGLRVIEFANKPVAARTPEDKTALVNYLVMYRRVAAWVHRP